MSTLHSERQIIVYARDVESHLRLLPDVPASVRLTGLLTGSRMHGSVAFFDFRDVTGTIQILIEKSSVADSNWVDIVRFKFPSRVRVTGAVGQSKRGVPVVLANSVPEILESSFESTVAQAEPDYAQTGIQMFLARLRGKATDFFRRHDFLEIEPKFISATWRSPGLEPLRVQYQGFGFPAFLAPSPSSQLLDALIATASERVFAVSRCFSTTYRDEKSSAESLILSAKEVNGSVARQRELTTMAVLDILGGFETLPEKYFLTPDSWQSTTQEWGGRAGQDIVKVPRYENYVVPRVPRRSGGTDVRNLFRLVWPPRRVIAEGAREVLFGGMEVTSTTLHLERMVSLLREVPIRHIRHLGGRTDA